MVNGDRAPENCELLRDFHCAGRYGLNGTSGGRALVNARVKFAGGLAIVEAFYSEGREDAAGNGSGEGICPIFYAGDCVAKVGEGFDVFGRRVERFDLRGQDYVLRWEFGGANGESSGGERLAVLGEEFYLVGAGGVGDGDGHQALRATI